MVDYLKNVRAVDRALDILSAFNTKREKLSLTEIMEITSLPKTTVVRLVATLEEKGFLTKDPLQQEYKLGLSLIRLGSVALRYTDLRKISWPVLQEIWQITHESISINIMRDYHRICIEQILSDQHLSQQVEIGKPLPMWYGASGKILLAFLPPEEQEKVFQIALKEDIQAAQNWEKIMYSCEQIKEEGYAVSFNERVLGAAVVATPIFDHNGCFTAGLSISGPTVRYTEDKVKKFIILAKKGAREISRQLGCPMEIFEK